MSALILGAILIASQKAPVIDVLAKQKAEAKASNRYVFAVFSASWCRSCTDLRELLESPAFSKHFRKKFVTTYVDVSDSSQVRNLLLRSQYCSAKAPMPAYAIIGPDGRLISNSFGNSASKAHPSVLSYPLTRKNIGDFLLMLNKVPKGIDMDTLWKLRGELEKRIR